VPDRISGVTIVPIPGENNEPPTTCNINIGGNTYTKPISYLFDRTTDEPEQIIGNIRLKALIGGYTGQALWSEEFRQLINEKGIIVNTGRYYLTSIELNQDQSYELGFGTSSSQTSPTTTATVWPADLMDDNRSLDLVLMNVRSWMWMEGYTDLTTPAINGFNEGKTAIQAIPDYEFRF